jgi:hypothetical protein
MVRRTRATEIGRRYQALITLDVAAETSLLPHGVLPPCARAAAACECRLQRPCTAPSALHCEKTITRFKLPTRQARIKEKPRSMFLLTSAGWEQGKGGLVARVPRLLHGDALPRPFASTVPALAFGHLAFAVGRGGTTGRTPCGPLKSRHQHRRGLRVRGCGGVVGERDGMEAEGISIQEDKVI